MIILKNKKLELDSINYLNINLKSYYRKNKIPFDITFTSMYLSIVCIFLSISVLLWIICMLKYYRYIFISLLSVHNYPSRMLSYISLIYIFRSLNQTVPTQKYTFWKTLQIIYSVRHLKMGSNQVVERLVPIDIAPRVLQRTTQFERFRHNWTPLKTFFPL